MLRWQINDDDDDDDDDKMNSLVRNVSSFMTCLTVLRVTVGRASLQRRTRSLAAFILLSPEVATIPPFTTIRILRLDS